MEIRQAFDHLEKLFSEKFNELKQNVNSSIEVLRDGIEDLYRKNNTTHELAVRLEEREKGLKNDLTIFKDEEKSHGKKVSGEIDKLRYMHWKVLGVGIALIGIGLSIWKAFG